MSGINVEGIEFSHASRRSPGLPKSEVNPSAEQIHANTKAKSPAEIHRIQRKTIEALAGLLAIVEIANIAKAASAQEKPEAKRIKPVHSITRNLSEEDMKRIKDVALESRSIENKNKISPENILVNHPEFIEKINQNIPVYKEAANAHNVPWELLAAVHYRESNFSPNPTENGQGPFQIYARPSGCQDFGTAANIAAQMLQEKIGGKLTEDTKNLDLIEKAGALYNGWEQRCVIEAKNHGLGADQWYKYKAYSMNNLDENHQDMVVQLRDNIPVNLADRSTYTYDQRDGIAKIFIDLQKANKNVDGYLLEDQL